MTEALSLPFRLRPATDDDLNLVLSSWLRSYAASDFAHLTSREVYFAEYHGLLTRLLGCHGHRVVCAVSTEDDTTVVGWAACDAERTVLYYVYVLKAYRRSGVARALVTDILERPMTYTHRTRVCRQLPIPASWIFNPYLNFTGA